MKNPLNGLSPAQLRDGVCVMSALYALDLVTTDNYNMKLQLLTSAVLDPRMQGMFREASEQLVRYVSRVLFILSKSAILSYDFIHGYFITECANEVVIFYFPEPGNSDSQNPQNT